MSRLGNLGGALYRGEVSVNFVGRQRLWYTISGIILVIAIAGLLIFRLNFSVEFKGGSLFQVPAAANVTQPQLEQVVKSNGGGATASATEIKPFGVHQAPSWQVQTNQLSTNKSLQIQAAIAKKFNISSDKISITTVGSSWGSQVSQKAAEALLAFLVVIVIYLSIAFEWRMAVSALIALVHDIVITVGVYALAHFQVSPATIIGLLTILGYSLYDTVVVFDKVRENTAPILGTRKSSYSDAANLALNQTLVRSINTSLIALLPVTAILIVGTLLLGNGELKDLALVLFVGMLSGTYSSIFIATPVLADLKEREPQYKQLARQVALRASGGRAAQRKAKAAGTASSSTASVSTATAVGLVDVDEDEDALDADAGADEAASGNGAVEETAADQPVGAPQPAAAGQPRSPASRPVGRQQPVRRTRASQRRPSGKKKRR